MKKQGKDSLCVLSDFDHTMTTDQIYGEWAQSCFTAISQSKYVTDTYWVNNKNRYWFFREKELDHTLDEKEKTALMQEWWDKDLSELIHENITWRTFFVSTFKPGYTSRFKAFHLKWSLTILSIDEILVVQCLHCVCRGWRFDWRGHFKTWTRERSTKH